MSQLPTRISVSTIIHAPINKVWHRWTTPEHITQWNAASDDWCCPRATNDLRVGGQLTSRMEARDGSSGFDFSGTYTAVKLESHLAFFMGEEEGAREVEIWFKSTGDGTEIVESFLAENTYPIEEQKAGWQSILDRFKAYVEGQV